MKHGAYTTCGYIVRKLAHKYGVNPVWVWGLLDSELNMRGYGCAISWGEAGKIEGIIAGVIAEDEAG